MNSNNQTSQDYSSLPIDQTVAPLQILDNSNGLNIQHTSINNVEKSSNTTTFVPQNVTFEFYFPLHSRMYHVTYTELRPSENARLLNNSINLSHIPNNQFPYHFNIQSLIQQQIQQQVQQPVYHQQDSIQQQPFDITGIQPNDYQNITSASVNGTISNNLQDAGFQNFP
jgi:hypothetical protein